MRYEEAELLAGPNGLIGARVEGIGIAGDHLLLDFGFKGTDDGDVQVMFPLRSALIKGNMVSTVSFYLGETEAE